MTNSIFEKAAKTGKKKANIVRLLLGDEYRSYYLVNNKMSQIK